MTQTDPIPVLSEILNSSHSGTGNSYYNASCPRKVRLDSQYPEAPAFELQVGLLFHKLMELWRTDTLNTMAIPENDDAETDKDPVAEALRLFKAYISYYGGEDGKPKDFNTRFVEAPVTDAEAWGVPFTMRTDAVVEPLPGCKDLRGLEIEPGLYLLDYKTAGAKSADQMVKDALSTQFKAYLHVWNTAQPPELQVKGLIVDRIIRYKRDMMKSDSVTGLPKGLETSIILAPTENEVLAIRRYYQWKAEFLKQDWCNLEACAFPRICRHFTQGTCDRISC